MSGPERSDPRRARFEAIAAEVYEPLQRYLGRRALPSDAEDALIETLTVVWRRLDEVPDGALPWCYGVARRCLANQRRGGERHLRLIDHLAAQPVADAATLDPQQAVEVDDPELRAAMTVLSDAEDEIVRLWAWEGLEPREIGVVLGLNANSVSVALARAKRKLRDRMQPPPGGDRQDPASAGHLQDAGTADPAAGLGGDR